MYMREINTSRQCSEAKDRKDTSIISVVQTKIFKFSENITDFVKIMKYSF